MKEAKQKKKKLCCETRIHWMRHAVIQRSYNRLRCEKSLMLDTIPWNEWLA